MLSDGTVHSSALIDLWEFHVGTGNDGGGYDHDRASGGLKGRITLGCIAYDLQRVILQGPSYIEGVKYTDNQYRGVA